MNWLKNVKKEHIVLIILAGVALMVISLPTGDASSSDVSVNSGTQTVYTSESTKFERYMEERIENMLSQVSKIDDATVLVTAVENSTQIYGLVIVTKAANDSAVTSEVITVLSQALDIPIHRIQVLLKK